MSCSMFDSERRMSVRRYNGTFVDFPGAEVESYIVAFEENWREFQQLRATIPAGGEFQRPGKQGMPIRVGGYFEGVCLRSYHMPIRTEQELQRVVSGYRYALGRTSDVQALLHRL